MAGAGADGLVVVLLFQAVRRSRKIACSKGVRFDAETIMGKCFVIQPFDSGKFDRRYKETFAPAIKAAGLEPYRIDNDPSVVIPIEDIEAGIRDSQICFADITLDNPNVWFEVGFAIAAGRPIVLACCTSERGDKKFPFDVQHRNILTYSSDSAGDFKKLAKSITERLKARLKSAVPRTTRMLSVEPSGSSPNLNGIVESATLQRAKTAKAAPRSRARAQRQATDSGFSPKLRHAFEKETKMRRLDGELTPELHRAFSIPISDFPQDEATLIQKFVTCYIHNRRGAICALGLLRCGILEIPSDDGIMAALRLIAEHDAEFPLYETTMAYVARVGARRFFTVASAVTVHEHGTTRYINEKDVHRILELG